MLREREAVRPSGVVPLRERATLDSLDMRSHQISRSVTVTVTERDEDRAVFCHRLVAVGHPDAGELAERWIRPPRA